MVSVAGAAVVVVGLLQQGQKVAANVAGLALVGDLIPLAVEADDEADVTLRRLIHDGGIGAGTLADVGDGVEAGIAEADVLPLAEIEVVLVHITDLQIAVDQIPVVNFPDDHNGVAVIGLADHFAVGVGLRPQTQARGGNDADSGFQLRCHGGDRHAGQDGKGQDQTEHSFADSFHKYPRFQNYLEDRARSSQTAPTSSAV